MNWMIDGAHGNPYREAMGFPQQHAAVDEWEIERTAHVKPAASNWRFAMLFSWLPRLITRMQLPSPINTAAERTVS